MAASLERIRNSMDVKPTPENKGMILTLRLKAYDNGMIELDGIPINDRGKEHRRSSASRSASFTAKSQNGKRQAHANPSSQPSGPLGRRTLKGGWHACLRASSLSARARPTVPGRSPDWLKSKNPACDAVKREAEEDWGKEKWR